MRFAHLSWLQSAAALRLLALIFTASGLVVGLSYSVSAGQYLTRALFIHSPLAGQTTIYDVSFEYPQAATVGSLRLEFCDNPLVDTPCVSPDGIDVSAANLTNQTGETGYTVSQRTANSLVLSRPPTTTGSNTTVSYRFENVVNPAASVRTFFLRITDYSSSNATGSLVNEGSFSAAITPDIELYTQVPPILMFCLGDAVTTDDCSEAGTNYADLGELRAGQTRTATAQLQARTNAQYGYSITVSGTTMTSGANAISAAGSPTANAPGNSQFGTNLVANSSPSVGADPTGPGTNAVINADYNHSNRFVYRDGDTLVASAGSTPRRKFTVSYIVNVPPGQPAGIYSTTLTYVCAAGF